MNKSLDVSVLDANANIHVRNLTLAIGAISAAPVVVNWTAAVPLIVVCVCDIGKTYGFTISKDEAVHFIRQCFAGAGLLFVATNLAFKLAAGLLEATGIGYAWGFALDASITTAAAYAIGSSAKLYFRELFLHKERLSDEQIVRNFISVYEQRKKERSEEANTCRTIGARRHNSSLQSIKNFFSRKKKEEEYYGGLPPEIVKRRGGLRRKRKPSLFSSLFHS